MIPVIDIFAGPGGLSDGFASALDANGQRTFDVSLSVEMDSVAFETLKLRTFFRQFESGRVPAAYYRHLRGEMTRSALYEAFPTAAEIAAKRCWLARLGPSGEPVTTVRERIDAALGAADPWVLIGGPPCQAYSLAGRSRNMGNQEYVASKDERQRLYIDYLQILADHRPAAFVMENVKGLLSAKLSNDGVFARIVEDLRDPFAAITREGRPTRSKGGARYVIYSLVDGKSDSGDLRSFVVQSERYGVPQARHRLILLGIREDLRAAVPAVLKPRGELSVGTVIGGLPELRSGLSHANDSAGEWVRRLRSEVNSRWANAGTRKADSEELRGAVRKSLRGIRAPEGDRGGEFVRCEVDFSAETDWFYDSKIGGVCNHSSRGHMAKDLFRYQYAACYAVLHGRSPSLGQFPTDLLPNHESADAAVSSGGSFADRFRVQVGTRPSTTIMSHISKDGHYYIHPDPAQCRSLTVREAARLQTFPDNYFFCGPRTAQYIQVGNAVPPLLAQQIADIVRDVLRAAGATGYARSRA